MIAVLPQPQSGEHLVVLVDDAVVIIVELCEGQEAVSHHTRGRRQLRRRVAKHLGAVVDHAVAVAIEDEPGIVATGLGPRAIAGPKPGTRGKRDAVTPRGQPESVTRDINQDW